MTLLQRIAPKSLSGRLFWGVSAASLLSVLAIWSWLNTRIYDTLDQEAAGRLRRIAGILMVEFGRTEPGDQIARHKAALQNFWQLEKSDGLLQNLYWLDISGAAPVFVASYSLQQNAEAPMQPPVAEDIEDLVYNYINELDRGELVFPDPYSYGVSRRFKIVLCPVFDANGLLESVVGIEADMEYLKLIGEFRSILAEGIVVAILLSLAVSLLLARNLSLKIATLGRCVGRIAEGARPESIKLSIIELDELYQAFCRMADDLEKQKAHVQQVFVRKLDELAFTGGAIAHEIRNPLSAIEMHFGLLKRSLLKSGENVASAPISEIDQQLLHLRRLLASFLDYSRKVRPQIEKVNIVRFIERVVSMRRQVLGEFKLVIKAAADLEGHFDVTMMQQVIENLVNNSFRAVGGSNLEITVSAAVDGRILRIEVGDNGPGISAAANVKLFTPFATGNADGSGFGLALSRKLVEAHGGEIYYNAGSSGGAVFVIEVPQHEDSRC